MNHHGLDQSQGLRSGPAAAEVAPAVPQLVLPDRPWLEDLSAHAWAAARANLTASPSGELLASVPGLGRTWLWDSCFMAQYAKYAPDLLPVERTLDRFYAHQRDDGFIGMAYDIDTGALAYGERINPPLLAWAEWQLHLVTGDRDRLARVLGPLVCIHRWIDENRRRDTGLFWYEDSGSSGMDNAPRGGYPSAAGNGSDLCHVDLLAQQALSALHLRDIAAVLGRDQIVAWAEREHRLLGELLEARHWSERAQFYHDLFARPTDHDRHNFVNHRTVAGFWPMLSRSAAPDRAAALVAALTDPQDFGTRHRVPSLSASDPNYDPDAGYWLGGVWSPTNYMVCRGLWNYGHTALACRIAEEHTAALGAVAADPRYGGLWECYAPDHAAPGTVYHGRLCRPNFVGWTGLSVTSLVIECMIGLDLQAHRDTVLWQPQLTERQGVRDLSYRGHRLSIVGELMTDGTFSVEVETETPFNLEVRPTTDTRSWTFACRPGTQRFTSAD